MELKEGDKVLMSQKKSSLDPPYDPEPYRVTKVEDTRITVSRGKVVKTQNQSTLKMVKTRQSFSQKKEVR